jgi:hypothetical protein
MPKNSIKSSQMRFGVFEGVREAGLSGGKTGLLLTLSLLFLYINLNTLTAISQFPDGMEYQMAHLYHFVKVDFVCCI